MTENLNPADVLGKPLELPCGFILKNRLVKAPMSDVFNFYFLAQLHSNLMVSRI